MFFFWFRKFIWNVSCKNSKNGTLWFLFNTKSGKMDYYMYIIDYCKYIRYHAKGRLQLDEGNAAETP